MLARSASAALISYQLDQMDASVAPPSPYARQSLKLSATRNATSTGIQSPLRSTARVVSSTSALSLRWPAYIEKSAGTEFHSVTPCDRTRSHQYDGSSSAAGEGMTTAPPQASIPKTS